MPQIATWQDVESEVYRPGRWLLFVVGTPFLLIGVIGVSTLGRVIPPGTPLGIARGGAALFAILGGAVLAWAIRGMIAPVSVRHAPPDVLPKVPCAPVIREGSVVHGRLTHELVEVADCWQFRPARKLLRRDMIFLLGFGIPFLTLFAGILSWVFHSQQHLGGWPLSILCGALLTALCGGTAFLLIGMAMRAGYRRLCCLTIPRNGDDLELESPEQINPDKADLATGLKWILVGDGQRQRLPIARGLLRAVQLCPWKFVTASSGGKNISWAVQGLLVLECRVEGEYQRLPLLLTNDFVGAARLMQRLATTLNVPYLFCADAEGWKAEESRANNRPPLRIGGTQS